MKPQEVYKIINESGEAEGVYTRGNYDKYDFGSVESARSANCHGIYKDKVKYKISKYRVTYELIDDDSDPASEDDVNKYDRSQELESEMNMLGLEGWDRLRFALDREFYNTVFNK